MIRLVRSEMLKLRTTHIWWIMLLCGMVLSCLAIAYDMAQTYGDLNVVTSPQFDPSGNPVPGTGGEKLPVPHAVLVTGAARLYTGGQFLGSMLVLMLGVLIITNEFRHKTASVTFLATPVRSKVVLAKVLTAIIWGAIFCLAIAALAIPAGAIFLSTQGYGPQFGETLVIQSVLLNALGFGIWGIVGLGLGTLLKNQIAGVIVAVVVYLGQLVVAGILAGLAAWLHEEWIAKIGYWLPTGAAMVMTSPIAEHDQPAWWAGALALLAYGVLAAGLGTALTVRRDVS